MLVIGIIIALITFFMLCGLISIDNKLEVMIKRYDEIIRILKK